MGVFLWVGPAKSKGNCPPLEPFSWQAERFYQYRAGTDFHEELKQASHAFTECPGHRFAYHLPLRTAKSYKNIFPQNASRRGRCCFKELIKDEITDHCEMPAMGSHCIAARCAGGTCA
jgi:hypothetical protein